MHNDDIPQPLKNQLETETVKENDEPKKELVSAIDYLNKLLFQTRMPRSPSIKSLRTEQDSGERIAQAKEKRIRKNSIRLRNLTK